MSSKICSPSTKSSVLAHCPYLQAGHLLRLNGLRIKRNIKNILFLVCLPSSRQDSTFAADGKLKIHKQYCKKRIFFPWNKKNLDYIYRSYCFSVELTFRRLRLTDSTCLILIDNLFKFCCLKSLVLTFPWLNSQTPLHKSVVHMRESYLLRMYWAI